MQTCDDMSFRKYVTNPGVSAAFFCGLINKGHKQQETLYPWHFTLSCS